VAALTNRAEAIEHHALQQSLIAAFGQKALANVDLDELSNQAAAIATAGLSVEFCNVLQLALDGRSLLLKASSCGQVEWIGRCVADRQTRTQSSHVLATGLPITVDDFGGETRFSASEFVLAHGIRSCAEVPITGSGGAYGVLGAYSRQPHHVSRDAVNYLQSIANTLATAMDRKEVEQRRTYLAQFDSLTGLANRTLFVDRFTQTLVQAQRNASLLFALDSQQVYVSASVGITIYPGDGTDADTLLRNADMAMYRAKEQGRDAYRIYLPSMNEQAVQRLQLQSELRGALERREFVLHYQPKVSLVTGEISGSARSTTKNKAARGPL